MTFISDVIRRHSMNCSIQLHSTTTEFCDSCSLHLSICWLRFVSSGTATANQPRPDKEVSVVFSKNSDSVDQRFELMRSEFSHSQSFSVIFTFLAVLIFTIFQKLLSSFASKMDPKRQLKIKTGVLKRYVSFAENFSQMRRMYNNNTLPFLGCTN